MSITLEQKEVTIGEKIYILQAFPTSLGLEVQNELAMLQANGEPITGSLIEKAVTNGAYIGSAKISKELFNKHFSRKYKDLMDLFQAILVFNYGEAEEGPNAESDTSEK